MLKKCKQCNLELDLSLFSINRHRKDGFESFCKSCAKIKRDSIKDILKQRQKKYYEENKLRKNLCKKERLIKNKDDLNERNRIYYRSPKGRYAEYKRRAKRSKINFELTLEQFFSFWQENCFYCHEKINTIGLDRIDNNKGYCLSNCVSCCEMCNKMKATFSFLDWIKHLKKIINNI